MYGSKEGNLASLWKVFWRQSGFTKRDLLAYSGNFPCPTAPSERPAMVRKRYPSGIAAEFFVMKRAPA